jgi:hypothetical protein
MEGEMSFSIGDRTIKAILGTMVFAPRDVVYSFTIDSDQVRILVMNTPAGVEEFFKDCSGVHATEARRRFWRYRPGWPARALDFHPRPAASRISPSSADTDSTAAAAKAKAERSS